MHGSMFPYNIDRSYYKPKFDDFCGRGGGEWLINEPKLVT